MSLLGTIAASSQDTLSIQNLPEVLVIDDVDADNVLDRLSVRISGQPLIDISNQSLIGAYGKLNNAGILGADVKVALVYPIALGKMNNKEVEITLSNTSASAISVYGFGTAKSNIARKVATQTVNDGSNAEYMGFDALIFDPANVDTVEIEFNNGFRDTFRPQEIKALMSKIAVALDEDGLLNGNLALINTLNTFKSAQIYSTGGDTTVLRVGKQRI